MKRLPTAPVLPGETLASKYKVERILGSGGMGIVVAARHLELDERVAIKFLLRSSDDATILSRFLREARAAAKAKSEHVCRVFDVGRLDTGEPYLVMEYLEGVDLRDHLDASGPLSVEEVSSLMIEACLGLSEAHALGIVHRDLKPANVFLTTRANGTTCVKLLDFGISKLPSSDAMTSTSALIGSPAYMSPEQIVSARTVDGRADIWSIGIMLHELVSGKPPFDADSVLQLSVKIREEEAPPLPDHVKNPAFDAVIRKCLAKDPDDRYPDVASLAHALAPFANPEARALASRLRPAAALAATALASKIPPAPGTASDNTKPSPLPPKGPADKAVPVGQVTLEPLSSVAETPKKARRWLPSLVVGGAAVLALSYVIMKSQRHKPEELTPALSSPTPSVEVAPPTSPEAAPSLALSATASSVTSPPATAPTPPAIPAVVRNAPPAKSAAPVIPASAASAISAPSASPPPEASAKKRRDLDRTDPYPPHP